MYYGQGTDGMMLHMCEADAACALNRWQHNDIMAATLKA